MKTFYSIETNILKAKYSIAMSCCLRLEKSQRAGEDNRGWRKRHYYFWHLSVILQQDRENSIICHHEFIIHW